MVDASLGTNVLARLARCVKHWEETGYQFVALPWLVPARYTEATKPADEDRPDLVTPHGNLVASAEQSFLMLREQGLLPAGDRFIGWTPCFRQEPVFDATHHLYFMKAELFQRSRSQREARAELPELVSNAKAWLQGEVLLAGRPDELTLEQVAPDQLDILLRGVELGSYGVREFAGHAYVYGTACAEPRFSQALEQAARR